MGDNLLSMKADLSYSPIYFRDIKEEKIKELSKKIHELENKKEVDLPERYIINDGATILFWRNGEKTVVKRASDDEFNPRLAFLTAFFQHYCGMSKNKANKYLANLEIEENSEKTISKEKNKKKPKHMKED